MRKVVTLFFTSHADTVGNAYRINRLKSISSKFETTVITNQEDMISTLMPDVRVLHFGFTGYTNTLDLRNALSIRKLLKSLEYDLLYYFHNDSIIGLLTSGKKLCEIHQSHELIGLSEETGFDLKSVYRKYKRSLKSFLLLQGIRNTNYSFAVSKQLVNFFIRKGVAESLIEYLPHGVDRSLFSPELVSTQKYLNLIQDEKFTLLYSGWVGETRGLQLMLEGLKSLVEIKPNIQLIIAGCEKEQLTYLEKYSKEHNLDSYLSFFGRLSHNEMPYLLKIADVCLSFLEVNESYSMSPPQKIFEYFAMAKPVIANKIPTHTDYIRNGYNGIILDELEVSQLVKAVNNMMSDKEQYLEMCINARKYSSYYEITNIEKTLLSKINEIIHEGVSKK